MWLHNGFVLISHGYVLHHLFFDICNLRKSPPWIHPSLSPTFPLSTSRRLNLRTEPAASVRNRCRTLTSRMAAPMDSSLVKSREPSDSRKFSISFSHFLSYSALSSTNLRRKCSHVFGSNCIIAWLNENNSCVSPSSLFCIPLTPWLFTTKDTIC